MTNIPLIIIVLCGIVFIAPFVAQILRLPLAVVEILFGCAIGYWGVLEANIYFPLIAKIGFLFLMFLAGIEVNLKDFLSMPSSLFKHMVSYFMILYTLSAFIVWSFHFSIVYMVAFPIVSLGMIMALVKELGKEEVWLQLTLMIGIFGELISITALTLLSAVLQKCFTEDFFRSPVTLVIFMISTALMFKVVKIIFSRFPNLNKSIMPE